MGLAQLVERPEWFREGQQFDPEGNKKGLVELNKRGISSVGRALAWHARGQRFDPAILHFDSLLKMSGFFHLKMFVRNKHFSSFLL